MRILFILFLALSSALLGDEGKTVLSLNEQMEVIDTPDRPSIQIPSVKYEQSVLKVFISLFSLVILVVLSFWLFRRLLNKGMRSSNSGKSIVLLERRTLSPKSMLYLVEVDGKKILLAESHLEIRRLANWDEVTEVTSEEDPS